jgi:hypothetical protein
MLGIPSTGREFPIPDAMVDDWEWHMETRLA